MTNQYARAVAVLLAGQLAAGCVVPGHMHVSEGISPQNADTNVRFRTTYYFRVFDYCWSADAPIEGTKTYREIVPETDTLYRYRMTGKASALGNQIKFESGTLQKAQIDPFGADVTYNSDINGFVYRSREEAERQAKAAVDDRADAARRAADAEATTAAREAAAADRKSALEDFKMLAAMHSAAKGDTDAEKAQRAKLEVGMQTALERFVDKLHAPVDPQTKKEINDLVAQVSDLQTRLKKLENPPTPPSTDVSTLRAELSAKIDELTKKIAAIQAGPGAATTLAQFCSIGQIQRRGFQIMGPEGMRPFDQESRLILAMHSSAKPLIETLSEYSGRLLKPQVNASDQLLPLARETIRIVETQRAVDRTAIDIAEGDDAKTKVADIFDAAVRAFAGETK